MFRSREVSPRLITSLKPDEWRLLLTVRPNVLLEGSEAATDAVVSEAMGWLPKPHATWTGAPTPDRPATLVVRSLSSLDRDAQQSLLAWLEAPGDQVQVISTTTEPLYPLVIRGDFLPNLYYRLNVLLLDIAANGRVAS